MDEMKKRILKFVQERDWDQFEKPKDVVISLVLEATELLEHFQWKTEAEAEEHIKENKKAVAEELADVLYWVVLISHYFDIDLEKAFNEKMDQNEKKYPAEKASGKHLKYTAYQDD